MPRKEQLFSYSCSGILQGNMNGLTVLVSEIKLPRFSRLRKLAGKCAYEFPAIPDNISLGTVMNLVFGDPRVMRQAKLISIGKDNVPKRIKAIATRVKWDAILVFKYRGKKFWADRAWVHLFKGVS